MRLLITERKAKRRKISQAILQSLAAGVVPRIGLEYIAVGREAELEAFEHDMEIIADGGSSFRLVVGRYGSGKSLKQRKFDTQLALLEHAGYDVAWSRPPYYYELKHKARGAAALKQELSALCREAPGAMELSERIRAVSVPQKHDRFVPSDLLREALARDYIDISGAIASMRRL